MKRLLFLLPLLFVVIACGTDDEKEVIKEEPEETEEPVKEEEPEVEEAEALDEKIVIDKTVELNNATIVLQSLRVTDDTTQLYGYWNHNSDYDKAHLDLLVTTTFKQNDEELEITNKNKLLDQKNKTIDGSLDLKIERIDDSPIELRFIANTDERETESITIDIP